MTDTYTRVSALKSRHQELGWTTEIWNDMEMPLLYKTNPEDEHDAIRDAVGIFDFSALRNVFIRGRDAVKVADYNFTRNMTKLGAGKSTYGCVLNEQGTISDDAIFANYGNGEWLLCYGTGNVLEKLLESAEGLNVDIEFDDDLHNLTVQGPESLSLLAQHTEFNLAALPYFHQQKTKLFGHRCRISRTGFTGERGYEILANRSVVCDIWDNLVGHGAMPCSTIAADKVRIEAGMLSYGFDINESHTPWEMGIGFTVSRDKNEFRGKEALFATKGRERILNAGLVINHDDEVEAGSKLFCEDEQVGVVNSPCWSHRMNKSLALCHVASGYAHVNTKLQVVNDENNYSATIQTTPFYDPQKLRVTD